MDYILELTYLSLALPWGPLPLLEYLLKHYSHSSDQPHPWDHSPPLE